LPLGSRKPHTDQQKTHQPRRRNHLRLSP
jgi:hypothetical protein